MQVAGDHLVRVPDLDHVIAALHLTPIDRLESLGVADEADDRVHGAAGDEGLAAVRPYAFRDGLDVGVRRPRCHHHDEAVDPPLPARAHARGSSNPRASGPGSLAARWPLATTPGRARRRRTRSRRT